MKNLYVFIIVLIVFVGTYVYFNNKPRHARHHPRYAALLRDDLYFYPPRFPIPRPALRHHEVPHRRHFLKN